MFVHVVGLFVRVRVCCLFVCLFVLLVWLVCGCFQYIVGLVLHIVDSFFDIH